MNALSERTKLVARALIGQPIFVGVEHGGYLLPVDGGEPIELDLRDAVLFRQVERVLLRLVDNNQGPMKALAGSCVESELVACAWQIIDQVRANGFIDGALATTHRGQIITGLLTTWDALLLERFDGVLLRVVEANPALFGLQGASTAEVAA